MAASHGELLTLGHLPIPGVSDSRRVRVYLPRGYDGKTARPVLYLFDGQNAFDDAGSFAGGMWCGRSVDKMSPRTMHVPIVVGIDHGGDRRMAELSPWPLRSQPSVTDALLGWMGASLIPLVQSRFHTIGGPLGAVVGGASLGGIAATYAHFRRPDLFGGVIAMSPSYWVAGGAIFDYVGREPTPWVSRIYVDCGGREGGGGMLRLAARMAGHFRERGYDDRKLMWRPDAKGAHNEAAWRRRLPRALRFMFRKKP